MTPGKLSFLITGTHRSGSGILAAMLQAHPDVRMAIGGRHEHLLGAVPEAAATVANRLRGFRAACEADSKGQAGIWGSRIAADPLTANGICDDESAIEPFLSEFADLKHIFVARDGRTYIRSMLLHEGHSIDVASRSWLFFVKLLRSSRQQRANVTLVKFEELMLNPAQALLGICEFLGLEYSPELLSAGSGRGLDREETQVSPLPSRVARRIKNELQYCGYLDPTEATPTADFLDEASLLSELQEEVSVMAQQLNYQMTQRRAEFDQLAERTQKNQLRFSGEVTEREERLTDADRDLRRMVREVDEREERLRNADRDIRRMVREVDEGEERLRNADRDIRRMVRDVEDREERLRNADRDIRRMVRDVEDREERLQNADRDIRRLIREAEDREERLRNADRDIRHLMSEVSDRNQRLVAAEGDLRRFVAELANARRQLQDIHASTVWRLMNAMQRFNSRRSEDSQRK